MTRKDRAEALTEHTESEQMDGFVLHVPPFRYLAIETDEVGEVVEVQQADTLKEIAGLLEKSEVQGSNTEIHDLDSGDIMRPDFERIYLVSRIYLDEMIVYQASDKR